MGTKDPFEALGVPPSATLSQIREAYRKQVKECLWDRARFVELNRAYEILTNPEKRQEFEASTGVKFAFTAAQSWWTEPPKEEPVNGGSDERTRQVGSDGPTVQVGSRIESTQFTMPTQCPVCQAANSPLETWCQECGFMLGSVPGEGEGSDRSARPRLTALDGTQEFVLKSGVNTVGREDADVLLADRTVSRQHARLVVEGGQVALEDLGSTNGSQVGGQPVPAHEVRALRDGDEVRFGGVKLALSLPAPEPAAGPEQTAQFDIEMTQQMISQEVPAPQPVGRLAWQGDSGREVLLYEGAIYLGRRSANDIVFREDDYISGQHARIVADEEGIGLIDLGSTNGTKVNGDRLLPQERRPLASGDIIEMGRQTFIFERIDEGQSPDAMPDVQP
ncbi:MAG: FHA domain-containing protein [Armatimonadetes bacterium]|nr:FHA domain-containing protein [Armatimonadota bacterium]